MSISKSQQTRLVVFVVIGLVLGAILVAIPLGARLHDNRKVFYAYFSGESLSGLEEGAQVKFHGVPIGKVEKISYDSADLSKVKAEIKVQEDFPMKTDMYAQTGMLGITGMMYVEILGGTNESPLLRSKSEIPTRKSLIASITGKADAIMAKVELLLNHLNTISEPDSLAAVKKVLSNLEAITSDAKTFFADVTPDIKGVSGSARRVVARVDSISQDIKSITGSVSKNVPGEKIASIITTIDSTSIALKNLSETVTIMIKQGREDYSASMENLRSALENANDLMQELAENPSLLLRNEQPKEREKQ
jgi:phospholipid/cholesterol/gamma-HCH transport system substrate-binding protein